MSASWQVNTANANAVHELVNSFGSKMPGIMNWPSYVGETYNQLDISEDCLYLDLWVPEDAGKQPLPVYLYYHGGANAVSAGSFDLERGATLAREENIIVVRPNYRLGALGWVHFGLISDDLGEAVNLGFQDQMAALRWVHDHIQAFGGDPLQITIGGESCGASAVSHLLTNPESRSLVRRAVIQSLSPFNVWCTQGKQEAIAVAELYMQLLKLRDPRSLMDIEPERLLAANLALTQFFVPDKHCAWRPLGGVVDGTLIPDQPAAFLSEETLTQQPLEVMIGFAKDEWQYFRGHSDTARHGTRAQVAAILAQVYGEKTDQLLAAFEQLYPSHPAHHLLSDIMSFEFFKLSSIAIASNLSQQGIPTYVFQFSYDLPGLGGYLRAVHTGDMPFVWRNYSEEDLRRWPSFDGIDHKALQQSASQFGQMYGSFIRTGQPGSQWPAYNSEDETVLWFGSTVDPRPRLLTEQRDILAGVGMKGVRQLEQTLVGNVRSSLNVPERAFSAKHDF